MADVILKIDKNYAKSALETIQKALKGNGVKARDIILKKIDGAVLDFEAVTRLKLNTQISERQMPGKIGAGGNAKHFPNPRAAYQEAEKYGKSVLQENETRTQIKNAIEQKPHHGFGLQNEVLKFPFLARDFISHEPCAPCQGQGKTQCVKCRGKKYVSCHQCHAQGVINCTQCRGNRQIRNAQGQMQPCNLCQGAGQKPCHFCRGNTQTQCKTCGATGQMQCASCNGAAAQSKIISAKITAQTSYDFDAENLPDKAINLIKEMGAQLAEKAHIVPLAKQDDISTKDGSLALFYQVKVPQADVEFNLKDKPLPAYLFGRKGDIHDAPYFIEEAIAPGLKKLAQAAKEQGDIADNMRGAMKYKTIRQGVVYATRYTVKKAVHAIMHHTPVGISIGTAKKIIEHSNLALNASTKKQRKTAIISGVVTGLVLLAFYALTFLRTGFLNQVPNTSLHSVVDIMVFGVCAVAGFGVWHVLSSRARKQVLQKLMPSKKSGRVS